jgi:hypothetical protein
MSIQLHTLAKFDFAKAKSIYSNLDFTIPLQYIANNQIYTAVSDRFRILTTRSILNLDSPIFANEYTPSLDIVRIIPKAFEFEAIINFKSKDIKRLKTLLRIQAIESPLNKSIQISFDKENQKLKIEQGSQEQPIKWSIEFDGQVTFNVDEDYCQSFNLSFLVDFLDFLEINYKEQAKLNGLNIRWQANNYKPSLLEFVPAGNDDAIIYLLSGLK